MATLTKEPWVTGEIITADKLNKTTDGSRYVLTLTDADRDAIDGDGDGIPEYNDEHFKFVLKLNEEIPVDDLLGMIVQCIATDEKYVELAYGDSRYFKAFRVEMNVISGSPSNYSSAPLYTKGYKCWALTTTYQWSSNALYNYEDFEKIYYFPELGILTNDMSYDSNDIQPLQGK